MKDARGQDSIRFAVEQYRSHVFEFSRTAACDDWHTHRFADAASNLQIKPGFSAIGVDAVQHDFSSAERNRPFRPLNGVQTGWLPSAMRKNLPLVRSHFFRVNRNNDALASKFLGAGPNQVRIRQS